MLSIIRRIRTRLPTCLSIGFGAFFATIITNSYGPPNIINERKNQNSAWIICTWARSRRGPWFSDGLGSGACYRGWVNRMARLGFGHMRQRRERAAKQKSEWQRLSGFFRAGVHAPPRHREQADRDHDESCGVADARVERSSDRLWQWRIEHALGAEGQRADDAAHRIHHARNAGIGRADQRQALFDGAHPRLLEMLV